MFGLLRAGGGAAGLAMLAAMFAAPATAAARSDTAPAFPLQTAEPIAAATVPDGAVSAMSSIVANPLSLQQMVGAFVDFRNQDEEQLCLAKAIYFEARGETLEGQLAVAQVVLNRAASGLYPTTICGVVTQKAQFSFIRRGNFPSVKMSSDCWHKALAIADIARNNRADQIARNVLWYHANYVRPAWGRRLTKVATIGSHIFYS